MPYDSSQGLTFKFNNKQYTATSVSVSKSAGEINATSTDIPRGAGCFSRYRAGGLKSLDVKVDWIGSEVPPTDDVYAIAFEGDVGDDIHGETVDKALCTGLSITAQAGELIRGSATFKVSID
jgi:hypothetical protein